MVRLNIAVLALFLNNASASLQVSDKMKARNKFISMMKGANVEPSMQRQLSKTDLTKSIMARSKNVSSQSNPLRKTRKLEEEEAVEEEVTDGKDDGFTEDDEIDYSDVFFDISKFSIKFHSCAALTNFDMEGAVEDDDGAYQYGIGDDDGNNQVQNYPYTGTQVINYRLCPTDTCQDDSWKGCSNVYGNYMISFEDYFGAQEVYIEETFEMYCDYCSQCDYMYKYFNAKCEYYDNCSEYGTVCYEQENDDGDDDNDDDDGNQVEVTFENFMECTQVDVLQESSYYTLCSYCKQCDYMWSYFKAECSNYSNCDGYKDICVEGNENRKLGENGDDDVELYDAEDLNEFVYMKMHCDGNIQIGLFSDDQCTNYISDKVDMYDTTGLSFTADDIGSDYMSTDCISCAKKNTKYYHSENWNAGNNGNEDEDEEEELHEMCEQVFEQSLKCHDHLSLDFTNYYDDDGVADAWSNTYSQQSCDFIGAVQKGHVDEYGFVATSSYYSGDYYRGDEEDESESWNEKFTNKINNTYVPRGYALTENQVTAVIIILAGLIGYAVYVLLYKTCKSCSNVYVEDDEHLEGKSQSLIANEKGVSV